MKKSIIVMALIAFAAYSAPNVAQERKTVDKATPKLFFGRVTQVDERTKAVTIVAARDAEKLTLNFSNPKNGTCPAGRKAAAWTELPKVGDVLIARYSSECEQCLATC